MGLLSMFRDDGIDHVSAAHAFPCGVVEARAFPTMSAIDIISPAQRGQDMIASPVMLGLILSGWAEANNCAGVV
jgi:hypothetical protein